MIHERKVDDQSAVVRAMTGYVVPAAADGQKKVVFAGESDCRHHICDAGATDNVRGPAIDHAIPDAALLLIGRIAGTNQLAL